MLTFNTKELKNTKLTNKEIEALMQGATLEVGFFETATYPNGTQVAQVAKWNELGTINYPARPFMRSSVAKNKDNWLKRIPHAYQSTGLDNKKALGIVGELIRGDIIKEITAFTTPPNTPSTIKAKGSSNPLIDTGLMRRSVTYRVSK